MPAHAKLEEDGRDHRTSPSAERCRYTLCLAVTVTSLSGLGLLALACGSAAPPPTISTLPAPEPEPEPWEYPRSTVDRPDDLSGPQLHVVYAIASDGIDWSLDRTGRISEILARAQDFLAERIGRRFRIDTYEGRPDISFVRLKDTGWRDLLGEHPCCAHFPMGVIDVRLLEPELDDALALSPAKKYVVLLSHAGNQFPSMAGGRTGMVAINRTQLPLTGWTGIGQGVIARTLIHEVFHLMGAVAPCAPNYGGRTAGHVADSDRDVMFASSDEPSPSSTVGHAGLDGAYVDFGRDDYYGHGRIGCTDISQSAYFDPAD